VAGARDVQPRPVREGPPFLSVPCTHSLWRVGRPLGGGCCAKRLVERRKESA
jgi:hypothetical protein